MSLNNRLDRLEQESGGEQLVEFWITANGMTSNPKTGETMTEEAFARAYPDAEQITFRFDRELRPLE